MLAARHHHADPNSGAPPRLRVGPHSPWLSPEVILTGPYRLSSCTGARWSSPYYFCECCLLQTSGVAWWIMWKQPV